MTRRPQKRRRLSTTSSATSGTDSTCAAPGLSPADALAFTTHDSAILSCVSCCRSLAVNSGAAGKQGQLIVCPRCQATSCSICSRTCTAVPPSLPPTPQLTFSPSPPGTPPGPSETRPLPQDEDDTPRPRAHAQATEKCRRRKNRDDEDDDEGTVVGGDDDADAKGAGGMLVGCGRTLCKNCCIENAQTGTTTCYDCYGLPPPSQSRHSDPSDSSNPLMTSPSL